MPAKRKDESNEDAESVNSSNGSVSARNSTKRSTKQTAKASNISVVEAAIKPIEICKELNDLIRNYRSDKGRLICEHFLRQPTKRSSLDYHEIVKQPIDLMKIQQRLKSDEYQTFQSFDADIQLLIANAKLYYQKESTEHKDALDLENFYNQEKKKRLDQINSLSIKQEELETLEATAANSDEEATETGEEKNDSAKKQRARLNASVKNSPAKTSKAIKAELLETACEEATPSTSRSVRLKSLNTEKESNLNLYLEDYFDTICSFQDQTQRHLATVFYELPSAKDYPEYYETIKNPIGLKQIARKILNLSYKSLKQMESDLCLMTDNAKRFNEPKSIIYKDACKIKRLTIETYKELAALSNKSKFKESNKSREKKHKLVEDVAESNLDDSNLLPSLISTTTTENIPQEEQQHQHEEEEDDEDEDDEDEEEDLNESNDATVSKRGKRKSNNHLMPTLWSLFDYMKEYRNSNQTIIDPFLKLPNKRTYPHYYEEIKKPITFALIKKNLNKRLYQSVKELTDDFELMFKNAMQFNMEDSLIYKYANILLDALNQKSAELPLVVNILHTSNSAAASPAITTTPSKRRQAQLIENSIKRLFKLFMDYNDEDTSTAKQTVRMPRRVFSQSLLHLPSAEQHPDYYEKIKDPIDFETIRKRVEQSYYTSDTEMVNDCLRVIHNAKVYYNNESNQIYKDAHKLHIFITSKYHLLVSKQTELLELQAPLPKFSDLKEKLVYLYNYINDFQLDKRDLAPPFRILPSKLEYPDYYTVIKKPIDMTKIWNKIIQHNHAVCYVSLDEMCYDFAQMFENACMYNEPTSKIYKDALTLQQAVFHKRDEIINSELSASKLNSSNCFSKDPINDYQNEMEYIKRNECLSSDFVQNAFQNLLNHLFDSVIQYQDLEGRILSDTFVDLYRMFDKSTNSEFILTFNMIKQRIDQRYYKRLDVFQEEIFQVFNQIRTREFDSVKINENSQLYRDAYDLQRYFILKRDEVCRNGDLFQSNACSFKYSTLDTQIVAARGHLPTNFDEADLLLVDKRFKVLEAQLGSTIELDEKAKYQIGNFYFIDRNLITSSLKMETNKDKPLVCCILASNQDQTKLIVQVYLQANDEEFFDKDTIKTQKFFDQEVLKTDLYALLELTDQKNIFKQCQVVGVKEFMNFEPTYSETLNKQNLFVCESIYSSESKYFRKILNKKWTATGFLAASSATVGSQIPMTRRNMPLIINRYYLDTTLITELINRVDSKLAEIAQTKQLFKEFTRQTVEYDSLPAAFLAAANAKEKEADEFEPTTNTVEDDPELMKTAKHYEQLFYHKDGELYRVGDYVYVKHQQTASSETKPPMIVRIDRLWSVNDSFYLRGALFLRPIEITHEPTRLFYKNEVFKEISREITASLDQIVVSDQKTMRKKCVVMNAKKYVSCRLTELDENDVYVCDSKYSLQLKTFRKFTKGLRKFDLSVKCCEDEVYFLRRELQLRKHMSPVLANLSINYDEEVPAHDMNNPDSNYGMDNNDSNEEDWSDGEGMRDDENSSHSFNINLNSHQNENSNGVSSPSMFKSKNTTGDNSLIRQKKVRVKRLKKSGYNLFSKDLRKRLRDTKSSLSFINMSKEVGNRWRALTDKERANYEERAKVESIKEQQAAAAAAALAAQQQQQQQQQHQTTMYSQQSPQSQNAINIINSNQLYAASNQPIYLQQSQNGLAAKQSGPVIMQAYPAQQQPIYQNGSSYALGQPMYDPQIQQQQQMTQQQPSNKQEHPKQVQHKEAYIRYIANMRKQQQLYQSNTVSASITGITPDWYNSIDVRTIKIKESKIAPPATYWVENCQHNDVVKHLLSLRYYLLNDAVNIEKYTNEENNTTNERVAETLNKNENGQECMTID